MNIRLAAFDLDGTILYSDGAVSEEAKARIREAAAEGVEMVPCTGRTLSEIPDEILSLPGIRFAIVANGASIIDLTDDREIYRRLIAPDVGVELLRFFAEKGTSFIAYSEGTAFCDERVMPSFMRFYAPLGPNYRQIIERMRFCTDIAGYFKKAERTLEKIFLYDISSAFREEVLALRDKYPSIGFTSSSEKNLEINQADASKGTALAALAEYLVIPREQVFAIGDGENDIDMMAFAGFPVAVSNARPMTRSLAAYVTLSNDEDGAAIAFRKFLRGGPEATI